MKIYRVGGCVRDWLMGITPRDYDYVVVGSTPEEMLSLGYTQVGSSFPVFLHPETKEEYALARSEISTGPLHTDFAVDFSPNTSLEDDLKRRDLTINAIAFDVETGEFIDPYGGLEDIENKVVRATSSAFAEDPLRVYRVARFMATLEGEWTLDSFTFAMMKELAPSLTYMHINRRWTEFSKMLSHPKAKVRNWFIVLEALGVEYVMKDMHDIPQPALHHPEGDVWEHIMQVVEAGGEYCSGIVRYGALLHDIGKPYCFQRQGNLHGHEGEGERLAGIISAAWGAPKKWRTFAEVVAKYHGKAHGVFAMKPVNVYRMLKDIARRGVDMEDFIRVCEMDSRGRGPDTFNRDYSQAKYIRAVYRAMMNPYIRDKVSSEIISLREKGRGPEVLKDRSLALWGDIVSNVSKTYKLVEDEMADIEEILKGERT